MAITSLSAYRNNSKNKFVELQKRVEKAASNGFERKVDERVWKCTIDKTGSGSATIRFLSFFDEETPDIVKVINYGFKGPSGKWYVENSLRTLGQPDPVAEFVNELYSEGTKAAEEEAKKYKAKKAFWTNILVVNDPADPTNNGTVRLFRANSTIVEMILDKTNPKAKEKEFEDDEDEPVPEPYNIYDIDTGLNFRLKIYEKDGYSKFDKCGWSKPAPIADTEEKMLEILNKMHDLSPFLAPDQFKTYDELVKRFNEVMVKGRKPAKAENQDLDQDDEEFLRKSSKTPVSSRKSKAEEEFDNDDEELSKLSETPKNETPKAPTVKPNIKEAPDGDVDPDLAFFEEIANGG